MGISVECVCGKSLRFKAEYAGKRAKCPACGRALTIPADTPDSSATSTSRPRTAAPRKQTAPAPNGHRKRFALIGVLVGSVVIALLAVWFSVSGVTQQPTSEAAVAPAPAADQTVPETIAPEKAAAETTAPETAAAEKTPSETTATSVVAEHAAQEPEQPDAGTGHAHDAEVTPSHHPHEARIAASDPGHSDSGHHSMPLDAHRADGAGEHRPDVSASGHGHDESLHSVAIIDDSPHEPDKESMEHHGHGHDHALAPHAADTSIASVSPSSHGHDTALPDTTPVEPQVSTVQLPAKSRTRAEVEQLIDEVGRTPPDWFDSTPLNYPATLDLSWPFPGPKVWDSQKNVGQFIWDVINPNPNRWREGVRFMHHLLSVNKDRKDVVYRVMNELGRMYHDLIEDYPRAAFWWRQAGVDKGGDFGHGRSGAQLAECYWRLGNKQMAVELLNRLPLTYSSIKLWGDMGELKKATQLGESAARGGGLPERLYMMLGDSYRTAGNNDRALTYYRKVLAVPAEGKRQKGIEHSHGLATASIAAIRAAEALDLKRITDGTYQAESLGYAGSVHVAVTLKSGRIESVRITGHQERQFYSAFTDTARKIVAMQGIKGVDATSSATITSQAMINATATALMQAMQ